MRISPVAGAAARRAAARCRRAGAARAGRTAWRDSRRRPSPSPSMRCSGSARAVSMRIGTWLLGSQRLGEVDAGLLRHHHVENEQVEGEAAHGGARRLPRRSPWSRGSRGRADSAPSRSRMRLSSSTTRICGALSSGPLAAMGFDRASAWSTRSYPRRCDPPGTQRGIMMEETLGRSSALIIASRKRRIAVSAPGPAAFSASAKPHELRRGQPLGQSPAPLGRDRAAVRGGPTRPPSARYSPGR